MTRTCLFSNPHKANGADATGVFTQTVGYIRKPASRPYGRYRIYHRVVDNRSLSIIRVSTTSGHDVRSVHALQRAVGFVPTRNRGGVCVVSRIRVLAARTFGTLLGALRRPPTRIVFVLTAARPRQVPVAVLSHYRHCRFQHVADRSVTGHLLCITKRRRVSLAGNTTRVLTIRTSNNVHSTLDVLSRYIDGADNAVSRNIIHSLLNLVNGS